MTDRNGHEKGCTCTAWECQVYVARARIKELKGALQKIGDCLTSGTGVVSSQAYATRAISAVQVLKENGIVLDHFPPIYNPFERLDADNKQLKAELQRAHQELELTNAENRMFMTNAHPMYETKERVMPRPKVDAEQLANDLEVQWHNGNRGYVITEITKMPTAQAACVVGHIVWSLKEPDRIKDFLTLLERRI